MHVVLFSAIVTILTVSSLVITLNLKFICLALCICLSEPIGNTDVAYYYIFPERERADQSYFSIRASDRLKMASKGDFPSARKKTLARNAGARCPVTQSYATIMEGFGVARLVRDLKCCRSVATAQGYCTSFERKHICFWPPDFTAVVQKKGGCSNYLLQPLPAVTLNLSNLVWWAEILSFR